MAPKRAPPAPKPKAPAPSTNYMYIGFWVVGIVLMSALGFLLGQSARPAETHALERQLGMSRKQMQQCKEQRERARITHRKEPNWDQTPVGRLQAKNDVLIDENDELLDENEQLKDETITLQEQIAELKAEVSRRAGLSDKERESVNTLTEEGNISWELAEILEDWKEMGAARKDQLISRLVDELLLRKELFQGCQVQVARARQLLEDAKAADAKKKTEEAAAAAAKKAVAALLAKQEAEKKIAAANAAKSEEAKAEAKAAVDHAKEDQAAATQAEAEYKAKMATEQNLAAARAGKDAMGKAKAEAAQAAQASLKAGAAAAELAAKAAKASTIQSQQVQALTVQNEAKKEAAQATLPKEEVKEQKKAADVSSVLAGLTAEQLAALAAAVKK